MTDSQTLLVEYARNGSESAFRELVSRYTNLVYSTALRLVSGDAHLAEDVAQTVFIGLASRGRALSTEVMLGGWLHQHTYHVATKTLRGERRRKSREREAVEMNTLQDGSGADWRQVAPILDEAITQLGSEDRTAILLRFFEQRDFGSVGEALGSNEDAARMRVNRALEKLHSLLKHRGVTLSAAALGTALATEVVTAAPAGLAATISSAALQTGTTITSTVTTTKAIAMSAFQKALISAIVVASVGAPLVVQHQAQARLHDQEKAVRQQTDQLAKLQAENGRLSDALAQAKNSAVLSEGQQRELLSLRGEVGRLRKDARSLSRDDMMASTSKVYSERVRQFKQWLERTPSEKIPELQFLNDGDWLGSANKYAFDTDDGYRRAASWARGLAITRLANGILQPALQQYAKDNNGQFPADLSQLNPYFKPAVDESILPRWEILPADNVANYLSKQLGGDEDWVVAPKAPVDPTLDLPTICALNKVVRAAGRPTNQWVRIR